MPVDPFGGGIYPDADYARAGQNYPPPGYDDEPSWWDLIRQGISEAAQTAQIVAQGYPPGSTIVYSPQYPQGQVVQAPPPGGYPSPVGPGPFSPPATAPVGGVNLSNTTLMLLVGGVLLFMLGTKRGR